MAILFGAQGAGQFLSLAPDISKAISATVNVTRLLEHEPDIDVWKQDGKSVDGLETCHIEFRDVYFSYPSRYLGPTNSLAELDPGFPCSGGSIWRLKRVNMLHWLELLGVASRLLWDSSNDFTTPFLEKSLSMEYQFRTIILQIIGRSSLSLVKNRRTNASNLPVC